MNLKELKTIIDNIYNHPQTQRENPENIQVNIILAENSIGPRAATQVANISLGFDWERNQLNIQPQEDLVRRDNVEKAKAIKTPPQQKRKEINLVKSDWSICKEAEAQGLVAAMTSLVEPIRTEKTKELESYFKSHVKKYKDVFSHDDVADILDTINDYIKENGIDKKPIHLPISCDTDIHLLPITENLQLKLVVVDDYYGDGESNTFVSIEFFVITEKTTTADVDSLVDFVTKYMKS